MNKSSNIYNNPSLDTEGNPKRLKEIDDMCNMICYLWKKCPTQRFGQLVKNIMKYTKTETFYVDDRAFKKYIKVFEEEIEKISVD